MRSTPNNSSGKWIRMNDEQLAREQAKFQRAIYRNVEKDAIKAGRDPVEELRKYKELEAAQDARRQGR